jgi:hypothetical protein
MFYKSASLVRGDPFFVFSFSLIIFRSTGFCELSLIKLKLLPKWLAIAKVGTIWVFYWLACSEFGKVWMSSLHTGAVRMRALPLSYIESYLDNWFERTKLWRGVPVGYSSIWVGYVLFWSHVFISLSILNFGLGLRNGLFGCISRSSGIEGCLSSSISSCSLSIKTSILSRLSLTFPVAASSFRISMTLL